MPYSKKSKDSLEWWEYDKLGTSASLGCVRLAVADAKWIYDNCIPGTMVEFYQDSSPGPLGKPPAQKIGEQEAVRDWDPTDPDANNPWRNYTPVVEQEEPKTPEQPEEPSENPVENAQEQNNTTGQNNNQEQNNNVVDTENNVIQDSTDTNSDVKNEVSEENIMQNTIE